LSREKGDPIGGVIGVGRLKMEHGFWKNSANPTESPVTEFFVGLRKGKALIIVEAEEAREWVGGDASPSFSYQNKAMGRRGNSGGRRKKTKGKDLRRKRKLKEQLKREKCKRA